MPTERVVRVFNPGRLPVQVHTRHGVRRVDARAREEVPDVDGPAGDHLRALLAGGVLRDETSRPAPRARKKAPVRKTSAKKASAKKAVKKAPTKKASASKSPARKKPAKRRGGS